MWCDKFFLKEIMNVNRSVYRCPKNITLLCMCTKKNKKKWDKDNYISGLLFYGHTFFLFH